jgi:hypothetical protein
MGTRRVCRLAVVSGTVSVERVAVTRVLWRLGIERCLLLNPES